MTGVDTSTPTRREVLRWAAGTAAVAALGPYGLAACTSTSTSEKPAPTVDVAIIGGGPSGLYAAYRLLTATADAGSPVGTGTLGGRALNVAVYEATSRLGGRIWSVIPPATPHIAAEFGGMRFLQTQEIVPRLVKALQLPQIPFSSGGDNNLFYLRGKRLKVSQLNEPGAVPYDLEPDEEGLTPAQLLLKGIETYIPGAPSLSGPDWQKQKSTAKSGDALIADQGFWNLLQAALSPGGYDFLSDGIGYPSLFENWNAAEQMQALAGDFKPGAEYFTIPGGYARLPQTLGAMAKQAGAAIHLDTKVASIAAATGGAVTLNLTGPNGASSTVTAKQVIIAIPVSPLEDLADRSPMLQDATFTNALNAVGNRPAAKTFFVFPTPWWEQVGITGGNSITDLPLKRIWYLGTEGRQPDADPSNTSSLMLVYNDVSEAEYWAGYQSGDAFRGAPMPRPVNPEFVKSAVQQLSEVHGVDVPQPTWSEFIQWRNLPEGSFQFWQPHAHSWEVIPYLRRPLDGVNLSICGDCWSPGQNWIESGLTTTEGLLQSTYKLRPPPWLPEGAGIAF